MTENSSIFLTPESHQRLSAELEELKGPKRIEISDRIAEARSHGDIRENADYHAAKDEQGLMEARIAHLESVLRDAMVQDVVDDTGRVEIGSMVTVVDSDGDEMEFLLAPAENRGAARLVVSPTSPLGSAVLSRSPGDRVTYQAPGGQFEVQVTSVRPFSG
jgi:transcription elongation factor GreA